MAVVHSEHPGGPSLRLIVGALFVTVLFVALMASMFVALSHTYSFTTHLDPVTVTLAPEYQQTPNK